MNWDPDAPLPDPVPGKQPLGAHIRQNLRARREAALERATALVEQDFTPRQAPLRAVRGPHAPLVPGVAPTMGPNPSGDTWRNIVAGEKPVYGDYIYAKGEKRHVFPGMEGYVEHVKAEAAKDTSAAAEAVKSAIQQSGGSDKDWETYEERKAKTEEMIRKMPDDELAKWAADKGKPSKRGQTIAGAIFGQAGVVAYNKLSNAQNKTMQKLSQKEQDRRNPAPSGGSPSSGSGGGGGGSSSYDRDLASNSKGDTDMDLDYDTAKERIRKGREKAAAEKAAKSYKDKSNRKRPGE